MKSLKLAVKRSQFNDNDNNVYLEVENCAENDENDNNDDCESKSIAINATTNNNNAFDDIAMHVKFNTRVKARVKAREEKVPQTLHKTRCCNSESVEYSSDSPSPE